MGLILLTACGGSEDAGHRLTQPEIDYLRAIAAAKCKNDSELNLRQFIKTSNDAFGTSEYYRNRTWKYEWKEGSGTPTRTATITSWKQDANNLYFIITTEFDGATTYRFLKIDKPTNTAMFEKLRDLYCVAKADSATVNRASFAATTAMYKVVKQSPDTTTHDKLLTDQFNFNSSLPAFFAYYKQNRTQEKVELATREVSANKTFTGTLTSSGDVEPARNLYTNYPAGTQYCIVQNNTSYDLPYDFKCDPTPAQFDPQELCRTSTICNF